MAIYTSENTIINMKLSAIILGFAIFIHVSCRKDEVCNYNLNLRPTDSSLFISYSLNGTNFKYFQEKSFLLGTGGQIAIDNRSDTLHYYGLHYSFDVFEQQPGTFGPKVWLTIWSKEIENSINLPPTYQFFNSENRYVYPKGNMTVDDTAYINGVSISFDVGSTSNLMEFFKYDYDTIYNYILKDSYFNVNNIEPLCNYYHLIEGEFETVIANGTAQSIINVENGKFRLLTKY